jgi:hypothetical protein
MLAIKHKPTGKFANITFQGIDAINLGINPKVYKDEYSAGLDLSRIEEAFDRCRQSNYNGRVTFQRYLDNLEEKQKVKINATRTKNIAFYKMKLESVEKQEKLVESYRAEDFEIVAI